MFPAHAPDPTSPHLNSVAFRVEYQTMGVDIEKEVVALMRSNAVQVPPFPAVAMRLTKLLQRENYTPQELVDVVRGDQVLAGVVLRLANSAAMYRGTPVTDLRVALQRIGAREIQRLALTTGLMPLSGKSGALGPLRRRAWREGLASARVCEVLARGDNENGPDTSFVAGLMHDIGRLVALACFEDILAKHPGEAARDEETWWSYVEKLHVELGMVLAVRWQLPEILERAICDHHHTDGGESLLLKRVMTADSVVNVLETNPIVTESELAEIQTLSRSERARLEEALPGLPAFLDAFESERSGPEPRSLVNRAKMFASPMGPAIEVSGGRAKQVGMLVDGDVSHFLVRCPEVIDENRLVKISAVDAPEVAFCAKVNQAQREAQGCLMKMTPFAMLAKQATAWRKYADEVLGKRPAKLPPPPKALADVDEEGSSWMSF